MRLFRKGHDQALGQEEAATLCERSPDHPPALAVAESGRIKIGLSLAACCLEAPGGVINPASSGLFVQPADR